MHVNLYDAQQALSFLQQQAAHIEAEVYKIRRPDLRYKQLIPIDTSANDWAKTVMFFSMDSVGRAKWFEGESTDMPFADVTRDQHEEMIHMAGVGYHYNLAELGYAMLTPGVRLTAERAEAASNIAEEFVDRRAFVGDSVKGWEGLINSSLVTRVDAANDGTGPSRLWTAKTADQIMRDVNDALTAIYTGSLTVEMADTVLLPISALTLLANLRIPSTEGNAFEWLKKYNVYTQITGRPLEIRAVLGLESAGNGGTGRMVLYRRDPSILKMHMPMSHRFLQPFQTGPMRFDVPGIMRLGPVEIRRPAAMRYVDGITAAP